MPDGGASRLTDETTEPLYRDLFMRAVEGIFRIDGEGRIRLANPAFARLFGFESPQALLDSVTDFAVDLCAETGPFRALLTEVRAGRIVQRDLAVKRRNGEEIWIEINARPVIDGETFLYAEGSAIDVSRRKAFEAELLAAKEGADVAARTRTEFLGNMSHELRTPLNAIIGFAEMIEKEIFGKVGSKRYIEYAADIAASGRHLVDLIGDVLDMSKIEAGRYTLEEDEVDLTQTIEAAIAIARGQAHHAGVRLNAAGEKLRLRADGRALRQVLLNLLSNAIKFTPKGGRVDVAWRAREDGVEVDVADTGIGISQEDLPHVIEPFRQAQGVGRNYGGTGLGLAITKRLIEMHGGRLEIESEAGKGTRVRFRLPADRWLRDAA